uniref:Synaptopodin 2b n=1 Tax=Oncorhynchus kisutch TaxID=8019 RepID=A0A8C7MWL4_ONCKI
MHHSEVAKNNSLCIYIPLIKSLSFYLCPLSSYLPSRAQTEQEPVRQAGEGSQVENIALLLTDAPNPRNRGVLMFKKQRQRVKNYTLVSYGTGQHQFDDKSDEDIESEDGKTVRFTLTTNDYSELEEDYSMNNLGIANIFQHLEEMERLPETRGKGMAMFAQRRQRMDEIALEHEEMRCKGLPVEGIVKLEDTELHKSCKMDETYVQSNHAHGNQQLQCKENQQEVQQCAHMMNRMPNHLSSAIPKPLVPNRTAKPFLGSQNRVPIPFSPLSGVTSPVKHHELKFKVSVPIHTVPQVWSPTGDFIASRDERISVPAIKTGILLDSKRRGANRASSDQASNAYIQNRGERRSYVESGEEEDYFSLGAEACNFMQPRTVKHKYPPPVAPKPSINPACPPWLKESSSNVLLHPARPQPPMKISYSHAAKAPSTSPMGHISEGHVSPAINGPTLRGRGAELFAKRKTRMEKYVVDAETVQANKAKSPSPTTSLPGAWRYSSNVRAPSPLSYNPRHAPCYPPAGAKQPPSTSPKIKPKTKAKTKPPPHKHLDALDVLKHQPYQLDSSLFRYSVGTEAEGLKMAPIPTPESNPPLSPKPAPVVSPRPAFGISLYPHNASPALHDIPQKATQAPSTHCPIPTSTPHQLSLSTIQMAPRPTFSAKKQAVTTKQWRSYSLSLPRWIQTSWQEKVTLKPPSPWEAASRSPLGLVDDAFRFQNFPQSISTNVNSAANQRSLPEPPDEQKRKVSLDAPSVSGGYYHAPPPAMHTRSMSLTSAPVYGPPFRQAQPLWSWVSATVGHMGRGPGHPCQSLYATLPRTTMRR